MAPTNRLTGASRVSLRRTALAAPHNTAKRRERVFFSGTGLALAMTAFVGFASWLASLVAAHLLDDADPRAIIDENYPEPRAPRRIMIDNDEQLAAFGEFVRAQRRLAQVSQRNLARMSGVSDSYLSQIERGNYRPSPQVVKALATAFGLEPKQLYTMLGFMDEGDDKAAAPSVEQAIQLDKRLEPAQKDALIRVYRSFVGPAKS
jgi:transcriptional regulator with XRE-family HTH domain